MSETGNARKVTLAGVGRLRVRWMRVAAVRYGLASLFYLALAGALALGLVPELGTWPVALGLVGLAAAIGCLAAWAKAPSDPVVAKRYDDVAGLEDRVSSSVELAGAEGPMVSALHEEAAAAAREVDLRRVYPYAMPREGWLLPVPAILIAAVVLLPGLLGAAPVVDPDLEQTLAERTDDLAQILSRERAKQPMARREELLARLEELTNELSREKLDKKDAMAELARMMEQLEDAREKDQERRLALKEQLESLSRGDERRLADQVAEGEHAEALNRLEELIDELQKKLDELREAGASEEELAQLEQELRELKELRAQLMQLLQIDADLQFLGEMIDFLGDFEGELADVDEMREGIPFLNPDCDCDKPGL